MPLNSQHYCLLYTSNGRLDAVSNAFKQYFNISYELAVYEEHSLSRGSSSKAVSYVGINYHGTMYWGCLLYTSRCV